MTDEEVLAAAEEWGLDLSLLRSNLQISVAERFRRHDQGYRLFKALRRVAEERYGDLLSRIESADERER